MQVFPDDPISVSGLMSQSGEGWTKLTDTVADTLLNKNPSLEREYLYYKPGVPAWYRSPTSRLIWDWRDNYGKDLYGTYYHSEGGSFTVSSSGERTLFGVSGSSGPRGTAKCLIAYSDGKDPGNASVNLCQDIPNIFRGLPIGRVRLHKGIVFPKSVLFRQCHGVASYGRF